MEFVLEPIHRRYAIAVSAKVACCSIRCWMHGLSGLPQKHWNIFEEMRPHTIEPGQPLPDSVATVIAVHRDGLSRLRAVYDHRIVVERQAPDNGLDHFARHLPEYCALHPDLRHHCRPQSSWLGSEQRVYTHILPISHLHLLPEVVGRIMGQVCPPLPRLHETAKKSPVSEEAEYWFRHHTSHDTALGWDGKTLRLPG